jgi:PEP-CTERM motif-containing protein
VKLGRIGLVLTAGLLRTGSADAGIIFDNGGPDQNAAFFADTTSTYSISIAADDFTLSTSSTISGVNWWGWCGSSGGGPNSSCPTGDFTLYFYNDSSGTPGTVIQSYSVGNANQTATSNIPAGYQEYSYSATISPDLVLAAGTYWLGISNTTDPSYLWMWETSSTSDPGGVYSYCQAAPCTPLGWELSGPTSDLAFNLTGPTGQGSAVPEPASLAIIGAGLLGLAGLRRRLKANPA